MFTEIEYQPDSAGSFAGLLDLPHAVLLDSGSGSDFAGRFDIFAADPSVSLVTRGALTEIRGRSGSEVSRQDPLGLVTRFLGESEQAPCPVPFGGGAIGCFAYDLGRRFEQLPAVAASDLAFPDMYVNIYDWSVVVDHQEQRSFLVSAGRDQRTAEVWPDLLQRLERGQQPPRPGFEVESSVSSSFSRTDYGAAFTAIQDHIRRGDCYQVNLTQRFEARVRGDSWGAYLALREINPAPFSAYMSTPQGDILSSSPERFLLVDGDYVETKPIKGTRPRVADASADRAMRQELAQSAKDQAENVMIVDLLRNDLGKACVPGSVRVEKLFDIESYANVHHMVSTVTGRLSADRHPLDLLRACFPGGSITGAPKLRAMEIIDQIEPHRRNVYCGSIGYVGFNRRMDLNITIRTLLRERDSIYAWAGGGIVADSEVESEYQESLDKAQGLLAVLADSKVSTVA